MSVGGDVVVLGGVKSHSQNKESDLRTRINYEGGQGVGCLRLPSLEEVSVETEKALKGNRFAISAAESEQAFALRV